MTDAKPLTPAELDEMEKLHKEAFCPPWTYSRWEVECQACDGGGDTPEDGCPNPDCDGTHAPITAVESPEEYPNGQLVAQISVPGMLCLADKNGALIAALRNNASRLIAAARRAEEAERRHQEMADKRREWEAAGNRMHELLAEKDAELAKLRVEVDCGQDGVCAKPPGCARHWEERNHELVEEAAKLRARVAELEVSLKAANDERYAAINEMAKARRLAQDAQSRYDMLNWDQGEEAEARGGQFARLWGLLKDAVRRATTAERERDAALKRVAELEAATPRDTSQAELEAEKKQT